MRYHLYYQNHSSNQLTSTFRGFTIMISFFLLIQCSDVIEKDKLTEGIIEYDIAYVNNSDRSFPLQLLPKTMELKFNRNYAAYTIKDRVGLFSISIITNLKKRLTTPSYRLNLPPARTTCPGTSPSQRILIYLLTFHPCFQIRPTMLIF